MLAVTHLRVWTLFLVGAVAGSAAPAAGAESSVSVAADVQYRQGAQAYAARKYAEALAAFEKSQSLEPSPNTRFKIAQCYLLLNKLGSAYTNFKRAAGEAEGRWRATNERRYELTMKAAVLEAAAIEARVPQLTLAVPSDVPDGFRILLDDVELPRSAWGVAVETDPGTHRLVAEGPRLKRYEERLDITVGQRRRVEIPLQRLATAMLTLSYKIKPTGLAVYLDEKPLPLEQLETRHYLDVGKHKVRASAPGYADFTWSRPLVDGDNRTVEVSLSPATGTPKWVFFTVGAASLVAAAVGTGFGVKAQLASDDEQAKPIPERGNQARDAIRGDATVSTVALSVAGALAVTTAILGFTTRWRAPDAVGPTKPLALRCAPLLGLKQAGFVFSMEY